MAELVMTQQEKDAATWLDLDDEALGKAVKYFASNIDTISKEKEEPVAIVAILVILAGTMRDTNATDATFETELSDSETKKPIGTLKAALTLTP